MNYCSRKWKNANEHGKHGKWKNANVVPFMVMVHVA
jgi:hypothetical protein